MPFLVYVIALVIAAGTLALSVELVTRPDVEATKPRLAANSPVRQIPLGKTPDVGRGDPHNQLTPVYPAAPGKDLPPPADVADNKPNDDAKPNDETKNVAATAPAQPATASGVASTTSIASTTGSASSEDEPDQPRVDVSAAAPNSCAINACSSAYRSFRASDCTYQPYSGPRKVCELSEGAVQNASAGPTPVAQPRDVAPRSRMSTRVSDLDAAARVVRQLPGPDGFADTRSRRVIVIERPGLRYEPGVVYEEW